MGQSASTPFRNNQPQPSNNDSNDTESTTLVQRSVRRIRSIVAGHPYQQQLHQQSLNSQTLTQHQRYE